VLKFPKQIQTKNLMNYIVTVQGEGGGVTIFSTPIRGGSRFFKLQFGEGQNFLATFFKTSVALPPPVNNDRSLRTNFKSLGFGLPTFLFHVHIVSGRW